MSSVVAIIHHHDEQLERIGDLLRAHGVQVVSWRGFGGAHAFIVRRRPDLVLLCADRDDREPALRLIEELTWDPIARNIPVVLEPEQTLAEPLHPTFADKLNELLVLIVAALARPGGKTNNDRHDHWFHKDEQNPGRLPDRQ